MKPLVMIIGILIAGVGIFGIAATSVLLPFAQSMLTPNALYIIAAICVCLGLLFLLVASGSRTPKLLRVLGGLIVVAGLVTPFFGVERSQAVFEWWSSQGSSFMRVAMGLVVAFGLFVTYAVTPLRRDA